MHRFSINREGDLYCENIRVADAATKFGTPLYLYSYGTIIDHYRKLENAFKSIDHLICYSLKANSNPAILRGLAKAGCGADIVSGGELYFARAAGFNRKKIVYAGVGKTEHEIRLALKTGILLLNIESFDEAELINSVAGKEGMRADVALRLNPDVCAGTHKYVTTGKKSTKFGLDFERAEELIGHLYRLNNLALKGLHLHIGSQITSPQPYLNAIKRTSLFVARLKRAGIKLDSLDIGGGLGIIYHDEKPANAEQFAKSVLPLLKPLNCRIILEPGRFIVGNSGILVCSVIYYKETSGRNFIIVDAGMNDLIRPSLYNAYHHVVPVEHHPKVYARADVVGPICESGDFLALNRLLPRFKSNDLIAVMGAGAYGFSMSSNYNARPRSAEAMVINGRLELIRSRETYAGLARGTSIPRELR